MATHTPGPWIIFKDDPTRVYAQVGLHGNLLCVSEARGCTPETARLIAAAPELLAALKALSAWHDHSALTGLPDGAPVADWAPSFDETVNMVHAAIAKAEGK